MPASYASRNIENLGLLVGHLACGSGFANRVTLFDGDWSRGVTNVMPGVMSGGLKQAAPIGADIVDRNATKRIGAWQCLDSKKEGRHRCTWCKCRSRYH